MIDIDELQKSSYLMETLIQLEDILDSLDIYVYPNWLRGEIVEGPIVRRHSISFSLFYAEGEKPDSRGADRLRKFDVAVTLSKLQSEGATDADGRKPVGSPHEDGKMAGWLVKIDVPRRLLKQINDAEMENYDDDVDTEIVDTARDEGMTDETAYIDKEEEDDNFSNKSVEDNADV